MSSPELSSLNVVGGRYVLEVSIGRGGMGEVWRAKHIALNSYVAIKLLHGALASESRTRQRFLKEAQLTAQLKTRHAVHVFDFGVTDEGIPYLVMELLDGETLDQRLNREGRLPPEATIRILRPAGRALDRAHQLGIIHRDFKPENLFIVADEEGTETVKVVDFGIAKLVGELEADPSAVGPVAVGKQVLSTFTRTATLVGTPYYMGPEQIRPKSALTPAVDIWAFGVVAFECLTGRRPFDADDLALLFHRIEQTEHPRATELVPEIPPAFDEWFDKACAAEPEDRFTTAHEAVDQLARALNLEKLVPPNRAEMPSLWLHTPPGQVPSLAAVSRERSDSVGNSSEVSVSPASTTLHRLRRRLNAVAGGPASLRVAAAAVGLLFAILSIVLITRTRSGPVASRAAAASPPASSLPGEPVTARSSEVAAAPPASQVSAGAESTKQSEASSLHVRPEALPLADTARSAEVKRDVKEDAPRVRRQRVQRQQPLTTTTQSAVAAPVPPPPPPPSPAPDHSSPFRLPPLGI